MESNLAVIRYVALGDSYTIGTSVSEPERWPNQLVARLRSAPAPNVALEVVANLGVNGYTSGDLIDDELPQLAQMSPDFVTVLVGVNDVVQRIAESAYSANVDYILDALVAVVGAGRVVAVATPDYTLTPQGAAFGDRAQQSAQIARFNEVMAARADARGIVFVDISPVARDVSTDRSLVARDGLHPSGAQYARWVDLIAPAVISVLSATAH